MSQNKYRQRGAVSLFVVIFAALLMTVLTISFTRIMIQDQQAATANDLSQSAYDSAMAGVEDAKRVLLVNQKCEQGTSGLSPIECNTIRTAIYSNGCNTIEAAGVVKGIRNSDGNVDYPVQQSAAGGDAQLNQAYTCVTITPNTTDYLGKLQPNGSDMIPLRGVTPFKTIEVSWFNRSQEGGGQSSGGPAQTPTSITAPKTSGINSTLPPASEWNDATKANTKTPSLLRAQLIQGGRTMSMTDFDDSKDGKSDANTLFLYPFSVSGDGSGTTTDFLGTDARRTGLGSPVNISCSQASYQGGGYACKATIVMPDPINGDAANRQALLRLTALYNATNFQVVLKDGGGNLVKFNNVQPSVDSTGRANDMFRRVESRMNIGGLTAAPEFSVDISGNLCKSFFVTDNRADYSQNNCTP